MAPGFSRVRAKPAVMFLIPEMGVSAASITQWDCSAMTAYLVITILPTTHADLAVIPTPCPLK